MKNPMKKLALITLAVSIYSSAISEKISYSLSMPEPHTHYFHVEMKIENLNSNILNIKMPVWAPGSYLVREFAKSVEEVTVSSGSVSSIDKNTWQIKTNKSDEITVKYKVYAFEMSVRTSFLDDSHGYLNGTSIFMYLEGKKEEPIKLSITPYHKWTKISTALPKIEGSNFVYEADNYDMLVDCPIEIGTHDEFSFEVDGVKHDVAMFGTGNYDIPMLKKDISRIASECVNVFGENPNKNYTFIIHNLANGGGGLEHINSTTLQVNRWGYIPMHKYHGFLSLVAHEYFHLWNVKRIRPASLGPFNYDAENYTRLLWLSEGFTSYYDELLLKRAGYYDTDGYLTTLASTISRVENQPGNKVLPVTEASFHAWTKAYRPNENSYNTTISYYPKGAILAAMLDLEIINNTKGEKNLDDVLRALYAKYYKNENRGFTDAEFQQEVEKVANKSLAAFFEQNVAGTETVDYNLFLGYAGCKLEPIAKKPTPYLGASLSNKNDKIIVNRVIRGTSAYEGGINANDEIIAIDQWRVKNTDLSQILEQYKIGDTVEVMIARDGLIKKINITLKGDNRVNYNITPLENQTKQQKLVFQKWLSE